jgi:hypothetical protein
LTKRTNNDQKTINDQKDKRWSNDK